MFDVAGLMHAIHELPHDDLPRLAFADWLEEQGQADRAEFIRVQLALTQTSHHDEKRYRPLHDREVALITAHKEEWFGPFRSAWRYYDCQRGFIDEVWGPADHFLSVADWFHQHHALQQVRLKGGLHELRSLIRLPLLSLLRSFFLTPDLGVSTTLRSLPVCREPLARRPLDVTITRLGAGIDLVRCLTEQPLSARLTSLDLSGNRFEHTALRELLDALPAWPRLVRLNLSGTLNPADALTGQPLGDERIVQLASHPAIAQLEDLNLSNNGLGAAGVRALIESPYLGACRLLSLGEGLPQAQRQALRDRFGERVILLDG
jgi:uncharacterized protein (TIGR02996 family)